MQILNYLLLLSKIIFIKFYNTLVLELIRNYILAIETLLKDALEKDKEFVKHYIYYKITNFFDLKLIIKLIQNIFYIHQFCSQHL